MNHPTMTPAAIENTERARPYRFIHKALRAQMTDTLRRVGRADAADDEIRSAALAAVEDLLEACESHLRHEDAFMHEAMRERDPGATARFENDHTGQRELNQNLRRLVGEAREAGRAADPALYRLYLALSEYVAHQFEHMAAEETDLTEAFWARFTDAEIHGIEARLHASIPPVEMALVLGWMIPALSHAERVEMFAGMRANMPPPVFGQLTALARERLDARDWARLARALDLPVVPGLVA